MLKIEDIKKLSTLKTKTIKVKEWGGDVKITQLSNKAHYELTEKHNVDESIDGVKGIDYLIDVVISGVVEPKLSKATLMNLNDNFKGVSFVGEEILGFSNTPKN